MPRRIDILLEALDARRRGLPLSAQQRALISEAKSRGILDALAASRRAPATRMPTPERPAMSAEEFARLVGSTPASVTGELEPRPLANAIMLAMPSAPLVGKLLGLSPRLLPMGGGLLRQMLASATEAGSAGGLGKATEEVLAGRAPQPREVGREALAYAVAGASIPPVARGIAAGARRIARSIGLTTRPTVGARGTPPQPPAAAPQAPAATTIVPPEDPVAGALKILEEAKGRLVREPPGRWRVRGVRVWEGKPGEDAIASFAASLPDRPRVIRDPPWDPNSNVFRLEGYKGLFEARPTGIYRLESDIRGATSPAATTTGRPEDAAAEVLKTLEEAKAKLLPPEDPVTRALKILEEAKAKLVPPEDPVAKAIRILEEAKAKPVPEPPAAAPEAPAVATLAQGPGWRLRGVRVWEGKPGEDAIASFAASLPDQPKVIRDPWDPNSNLFRLEGYEGLFEAGPTCIYRLDSDIRGATSPAATATGPRKDAVAGAFKILEEARAKLVPLTPRQAALAQKLQAGAAAVIKPGPQSQTAQQVLNDAPPPPVPETFSRFLGRGKEALVQASKDWSFAGVNQFLWSNEALLRRWGPSARAFLDLMHEWQNRYMQLADRLQFDMSNALRTLRSPREVDNFVDVVEGKAEPISEGVRRAARNAKRITDFIADSAKRLGIQTRIMDEETGARVSVPFVRRENYFPYVVDRDSVKPAQKDAMVRALAVLVKEQNPQLALNDTAAWSIAQRMWLRGESGGPFAPHLELARLEMTKPPNRNPFEVYPYYLRQVAKRLASADVFGANMGRLREVMEGIEKETEHIGARRYAEKLVQNVTGQDIWGAGRNSAQAVATAAEIAADLGPSTIDNLAQPAFLTLLTDMRATLRGLRSAFRGDTKRLTAAAGGLASDVWDTAARAAGMLGQQSRLGRMLFPAEVRRIGEPFGATATRRVLKHMRFSLGDELMTAASSGAVRDFLPRALDQVARGGLRGAANRRRLNILGLSDARINAALRRGFFTARDFRDATSTLLRKGITRQDPMFMPLMASDDRFRILYLYNNFIRRQAAVMRESVLNELRHGNPMPLFTTVAVFLPTGVVTRGIRNLLSGRPPVSMGTNPVVWALDTIAYAGANARFWRMVEGAVLAGGSAYGLLQLYHALPGAAMANRAFRMVRGTGEILQGKPERAAKGTVRALSSATLGPLAPVATGIMERATEPLPGYGRYGSAYKRRARSQ